MGSTPKYTGKAAFHLFELDSLATTVITDLTRHAVALREQAVAAADLAERDELRYQAEEQVIKARVEIAKQYGDTALADEIEELVDGAVSAVRMPW
jgi:hypothetical protein